MLGSEPDFLPETVIGFLVLSPGKRFSRVTSAYSVLPLRGAAPGSPWRRERHGTATTAVRFSLLRKKARVRESTAGKSLCYLWLQRILRSRLIFCVMPGMAQERTGAASRRRPCTPGSGQQNRRYAVPSTYPCRLRVGPRQRPCKTRPSARIHAGCPGLPGTSQRF
nr:Uncharacterised protein [Klebsiella pneumoniae]